MTKGYKAMIKDRCPYVVNLAFKWCTEFGRLSNIGKEPHERIKYAVKTRWIDRVYQENVAIYNTGRGTPRTDEKNASLRKALGIHEGSQNFNFADSINLEGINKVFNSGERAFWIWVNSWVVWFQENYKYLENYYNISCKCGNMALFDNALSEKASFLDEYFEDFSKFIKKTFN